jgi:hypothetical protein
MQRSANDKVLGRGRVGLVPEQVCGARVLMRCAAGADVNRWAALKRVANGLVTTCAIGAFMGAVAQESTSADPPCDKSIRVLRVLNADDELPPHQLAECHLRNISVKVAVLIQTNGRAGPIVSMDDSSIPTDLLDCVHYHLKTMMRGLVFVTPPSPCTLAFPVRFKDLGREKSEPKK